MDFFDQERLQGLLILIIIPSHRHDCVLFDTQSVGLLHLALFRDLLHFKQSFFLKGLYFLEGDGKGREREPELGTMVDDEASVGFEVVFVGQEKLDDLAGFDFEDLLLTRVVLLLLEVSVVCDFVQVETVGVVAGRVVNKEGAVFGHPEGGL